MVFVDALTKLKSLGSKNSSPSSVILKPLFPLQTTVTKFRSSPMISVKCDDDDEAKPFVQKSSILSYFLILITPRLVSVGWKKIDVSGCRKRGWKVGCFCRRRGGRSPSLSLLLTSISHSDSLSNEAREGEREKNEVKNEFLKRVFSFSGLGKRYTGGITKNDIILLLSSPHHHQHANIHLLLSFLSLDIYWNSFKPELKLDSR